MKNCMDDSAANFPMHVMPEFIHMLDSVIEKLSDILANFAENWKQPEFQKEAPYLRAELGDITQFIKHWETEYLSTPQQQTNLKALQQKFEEAKKVISKMEVALRTYH